MSPFNAGEFTDMDGKEIEEAGSHGRARSAAAVPTQLVVERWSSEGRPGRFLPRRMPQVRLQRPAGRDAARGSAGMERAGGVVAVIPPATRHK